MTIPSNPIELFTPFLPSTFYIPEEEDRVKSYIGDKFSQFSDVINDKKIGAYTQTAENLNGEKWSYLTTAKVRSGYQSIAYIPSYPATETLTLTRTSLPQYPIGDINSQFVISLTYGTASKPCSAVGAGDGNYFTFMNQGDSRISYTMSDTTIIITTMTDLSAYSGFIVIHYIRDGF